jgi:hypothetical protein
MAPTASRKSLQYLADEKRILGRAATPQLPGYLAQSLESLATTCAVD